MHLGPSHRPPPTDLDANEAPVTQAARKEEFIDLPGRGDLVEVVQARNTRRGE
jgi:hypothetical protein